MTWRAVAVGSLAVVAFVGLVATSAVGAATEVGTPSITPSTVDTGESTTLSFAVTVDGVDTSDATTGGAVTFDLSTAVDLADGTVSDASVTPNATGVSATVDDATHNVTVTWNDDTGVVDDTLTVNVTIDGVVVDRTGTTDVVASADADGTGGVDATGAAGQLTAVATASDRSVTQTPARLYLGERNVDVTGLASANPAGASQSFYGLGGDADGTSATADETLSVDVIAANRFVPGSYNLSATTGTTDVVIVEPRVTELSLYAGTTTAAADVTNQSIPRTTETLTLATEFNFDESEGVRVTVDDEHDVGITRQLTATPTVTSSGGTVSLDVSDLPVGDYRVTVEGADELDTASKTVSFRVRDPEKSVTLSKTRVVRGERTVASLAGAPGDVRYLRISGTELSSGTLVNPSTARALFERTSQVQSVGADSDANYLYAVVALDDDGISDVRVRTELLATGSVDVELAPDVDAPTEDEVALDVRERTVTVDSLPPTAVGETVSVSGTAPESEQVKLYAAVDRTYVPLYEDADAGTLAEPEVRSDGTWRVDVDTAAVVDQPAAYRVVAVGDPGSTRLGSTRRVDADSLRDLEPRGSTSLTTVEGTLSFTASRTTIAATGTDEFTLSGVAAGQVDDLRLYHVGPRGRTDWTLVETTAEGFEETVDGVDRRGTHTYLVVATGRDGSYAYAPDSGPSVDSLLSGRETRTAALAILVDAYTGAGSDDRLARVDVTASDASVTVSTPSDGASVTSETLAVAGRSTSEDGSPVFVELTDDGTALRLAEASVTNGSWNATLDLDDVSPGTYRLAVESAVDRSVRVVTVSAATPSSARPSSGTARTQTDSASGTETRTAVDATAVDDASTTDSPADTTSTALPGFDEITGATALVVTALLGFLGLSRRRSERR